MNVNKILRCLIKNKTFNEGSKLRTLLQHGYRVMSVNASVSTLGKERDTFQDVLPSIINSIESNPKFSQVKDVSSWIKKMLDYTLVGGKRNRGLATVLAYEMLEKPEHITEESLRLARVIGWCVEMLQAYYLVVDDIMDGSTTRRGMPCWYLMPNVGLGAINDSILLYCSILETLRENLGDTPRYYEILHHFNEALLYTSMGQHLDYTMAHRNKNDYSMFTIERYNSIVKYKTSYYTFRLPVFLGLALAGNTNEQTRKDVEVICFELGRLFQIQDDYIDCFGDETITGKKGTDIQEGKCSWLAVTALQLCNQTQLSIFLENYASKEPEQVERIKWLFKELQIPQLYKEEEIGLYESIVKRSHSLPENVSSAFFLKLLELMYKRIK